MSQKGAEVFEMLLSVCCHLHHNIVFQSIQIKEILPKEKLDSVSSSSS
jgi:hypothetical protein